MTEINKQINHCDFKINEDLLVEIGIFKEIFKGFQRDAARLR